MAPLSVNRFSEWRGRAKIRGVVDAVFIVVTLVGRATEFVDHGAEGRQWALVQHRPVQVGIVDPIVVVVFVFGPIKATVEIPVRCVVLNPSRFAFWTSVVDVQHSVVIVVHVLATVKAPVEVPVDRTEAGPAHGATRACVFDVRPTIVVVVLVLGIVSAPVRVVILVFG
jgi:hypothetical protein